VNFNVDPEFTLVIEAQHVRLHGPNQQINWPSVEALLLSAHRWIVIAEDEGVPIEKVQPAEWQGPTFRTIETHDDKTGKKLSTKQRSKRAVERQWSKVRRLELELARADAPTPALALGQLVPTTKLSKDECDVVCIGRWFVMHGSRQRSAR